MAWFLRLHYVEAGGWRVLFPSCSSLLNALVQHAGLVTGIPSGSSTHSIHTQARPVDVPKHADHAGHADHAQHTRASQPMQHKIHVEFPGPPQRAQHMEQAYHAEQRAQHAEQSYHAGQCARQSQTVQEVQPARQRHNARHDHDRACEDGPKAVQRDRTRAYGARRGKRDAAPAGSLQVVAGPDVQVQGGGSLTRGGVPANVVAAHILGCRTMRDLEDVMKDYLTYFRPEHMPMALTLLPKLLPDGQSSKACTTRIAATLSAGVQGHMQVYDARQLSNCLWALGKLQLNPFGIVHAICTQLLHENGHKLHRCNSQEVGLVAWGLARLQPLLSAAAQQRQCDSPAPALSAAPASVLAVAGPPDLATARRPVLPAQLAGLAASSQGAQVGPAVSSGSSRAQLAAALAGLGGLAARDGSAGAPAAASPVESVWAELEGLVQQRAWGGRLECCDTSRCAWAFAKAGRGGRALFGALVGGAGRRLNEFQAQDVSNLVWAMATVNYVKLEFLEACATRVDELRAEFKGQELSSLAWSYATMDVYSPLLCSAIARVATPNMQLFNPRQLSNLVWAFATFRHYDEQLMEALQRSVRSRISELNSWDTASLLWSLAMLNTPSKDGTMVELLGRQLLRSRHQWNAQDVVNTLYACAIMQHRHEPLLHALHAFLHGCTRRDLNTGELRALYIANELLHTGSDGALDGVLGVLLQGRTGLGEGVGRVVMLGEHMLQEGCRSYKHGQDLMGAAGVAVGDEFGGIGMAKAERVLGLSQEGHPLPGREEGNEESRGVYLATEKESSASMGSACRMASSAFPELQLEAAGSDAVGTRDERSAISCFSCLSSRPSLSQSNTSMPGTEQPTTGMHTHVCVDMNSPSHFNPDARMPSVSHFDPDAPTPSASHFDTDAPTPSPPHLDPDSPTPSAMAAALHLLTSDPAHNCTAASLSASLTRGSFPSLTWPVPSTSVPHPTMTPNTTSGVFQAPGLTVVPLGTTFSGTPASLHSSLPPTTPGWTNPIQMAPSSPQLPPNHLPRPPPSFPHLPPSSNYLPNSFTHLPTSSPLPSIYSPQPPSGSPSQPPHLSRTPLHPSLGLIPTHLRAACRAAAASAHKTQPRSRSHFQQQVAHTLLLMGLDPVEELCLGGSMLSIDIALDMAAVKVAVECDGPSHYTRSQPCHRMGPTVARDMRLQQRGWVVVVVPFFEWDELRDEDAQLVWLYNRLMECGVPV